MGRWHQHGVQRGSGRVWLQGCRSRLAAGLFPEPLQAALVARGLGPRAPIDLLRCAFEIRFPTPVTKQPKLNVFAVSFETTQTFSGCIAVVARSLLWRLSVSDIGIFEVDVELLQKFHRRFEWHLLRACHNDYPRDRSFAARFFISKRRSVRHEDRITNAVA